MEKLHLLLKLKNYKFYYFTSKQSYATKLFYYHKNSTITIVNFVEYKRNFKNSDSKTLSTVYVLCTEIIVWKM